MRTVAPRRSGTGAEGATRYVPLAVALVLAAALGLTAMGGSLANGDEAVYAELGREMRRSGDWLTLRYDGQALHQRPPLYVWVVAATGASRLPSVLFTALTALAVAALARRLGGEASGAAAAALLYGVLALTWRYGRAVESDPLFALLCVLAVERFLARRPLAFGLLLGAACMVKQVVGLLPLAAPLACLAAAPRPVARARPVLLAAAGFLVLWAPWHLVMTALHGAAFWRGLYLHNVVERAATPLLGESSPTFYLATLWRREGPLLLAVLGALMAVGAIRAARTRAAVDLVAVSLPLVALVAFSLARTRVEYYLLAVGPFLATLAWHTRPHPWHLAFLLPIAILSHRALPDLSGLDPSREVAELARAAAAERPARLYVIGLQPSAPRYYADLPTTRLVARVDERAHWSRIDVLALPGGLEVAGDCAAPAFRADHLFLTKRTDPAFLALAPCLGDPLRSAGGFDLRRARGSGTTGALTPAQ